MNGDGRRPPDPRGPEGPLSVFNMDVSVVMGMGIFSRSTASAKRSNPLPKQSGRSGGRFVSIKQGRISKDAGFIDEAVEYVADTYNPDRIIVYGPAASGFVDDMRSFQIMLLFDSISSTRSESMESEIRSHFVRRMHVNGDAVILTSSEFEEDSMVRGTDSFKARTTGYVAYEA